MSGVIDRLLGDYLAAASFRAAAVTEETILHLVEQARLAPSANNTQPWRFHVYRSPERITAIAERIGLPGLGTAGAMLAVTAKEGLFTNRWKQQPFAMIDVPIACLHVLLAAQARGVGSRLVLSFDRKKAAASLSLPKGEPLVALIFLGEAETFERRGTANRAEIVHDERY